MSYDARTNDPQSNLAAGISANPGAGPVVGMDDQLSKENANANIEAFVGDLRTPAYDGDVLPDPQGEIVVENLGVSKTSKLVDTDDEGRQLRPEDWQMIEVDDPSRYSYRLVYAPTGRSIEVDMPALPLDQVRFVQAPGQNIWHFPRLYVDGSSWVWRFAHSIAIGALAGEEEE